HYLLGLKLATVSNETCGYYCPYCNQEEAMTAVPQAAFAAKKIRQNEDKLKAIQRNSDPMNYSSKYMNSIWGQYNRYSVHNLKKIMDVNPFAVSFQKSSDKIAVPLTPEKTVFTNKELGPSIPFATQKMYN
ncbi:hypothetical protein JTB14_027052, partial [Gonioctena quinquepunctata]